MDWQLAIEASRQALKRVLLAIVAMAGLADGATTHLPRRLHRAVLRLLRPAESAARRLIVAAARGLADPALPPLRAPRPKPRPTILRGGIGTGIVMPRPSRQPGGRPQARLSLPLLDAFPRLAAPRSRSAPAGIPRISLPGFGAPFPVAVRRLTTPNDPIEAARLEARLRALGRALDDLDAEARRFARWRSRTRAAAVRDPAVPRRRFRRVSPLRPGRPPGSLLKPEHEVHEVLGTLHGLAVWALERPDTS